MFIAKLYIRIQQLSQLCSNTANPLRTRAPVRLSLSLSHSELISLSLSTSLNQSQLSLRQPHSTALAALLAPALPSVACLAVAPRWRRQPRQAEAAAAAAVAASRTLWYAAAACAPNRWARPYRVEGRQRRAAWAPKRPYALAWRQMAAVDLAALAAARLKPRPPHPPPPPPLPADSLGSLS